MFPLCPPTSLLLAAALLPSLFFPLATMLDQDHRHVPLLLYLRGALAYQVACTRSYLPVPTARVVPETTRRA